jgi:hypothetical protein
MADINSMLQTAATIKTETIPRANTALKVGGLLEHIINYMSGIDNDLETFKWLETENYSNGEIRIDDGKWWESKITDGVTINQGNKPVEGVWWTELSPANESLIKAWTSNTVFKGQVCVVHYLGDNKLYYLNQNVTRPFLSVNFLTERTENKWVAYTGASGGLSPEQEAAIATIPNKADKITGGTAGNLVRRNAQGNIEDAGVAPEQLLSTLNIDVSGINVGESIIPRATKQLNGSLLFEQASELLDKHVAQTVGNFLTENANWGNIVGKSSDWIRIFGNNIDGEIGDVGQEYVNNEGVFFECRNSLLATQANGGFADWVRNRNRDVLKSTISLENTIINAVINATWNDTTNRAAITTPRCKIGDWFVVHPDGYKYSCYLEQDTNSDGQADTWWWIREALPATETAQIFKTGNYINLCNALEAHDFNVSVYDPSVLASPNEKGSQGQEYMTADRRIFKAYWDGSKIIWEQIR